MNIKKLFRLSPEEKQPDKLIPKNITFRLEQYDRLPEIWLLVWNICHYMNVPAKEVIKQAIVEYHLNHIQKSFDDLENNESNRI